MSGDLPGKKPQLDLKLFGVGVPVAGGSDYNIPLSELVLGHGRIV